ncbi:hypothetical protein CCMSSC00406_0008621 [Pleurotus cornucopiae]|uniref:Uncharacterized protein n=1 Tax=Pleurotus cornucopiae TaxID=5321 RepID=A0ACB7IIE7_PLECO|nr:hypothetical protein CCMSSC00406_0008621 [Pleurotus cornucopiae]
MNFSPPLQLIKSTQFWFSDGNVILVSKPHMGFKVHRGQLARHSDVFSTLFDVPQPPNQPLIDGCPFVELHDNPLDLAHFLKALYDGIYFSGPKAGDFPAVAGVLRLSTKYFVEHLRQQCLQRLHHDWPATLVEWDRREDAATTANGQYSPRIYYPHPILVIQLAMELDIPSIAPAAFYDLARYGPTKILTGINAVQPACDQEPQLGISSTTQDLLVRTFCGRESGQRYIADFLARELEDRPLSRACANRDVTLGAVSHADSGRLGINDCYESFYYILLNILRAIGGIASGRDADPVFTLKQTKEMLSRTDFSDGSEDGKLCGLRMCGACREEFEKCVGRAREKAWQSIPGWFDVSETWRSARGSVEGTAVAW